MNSFELNSSYQYLQVIQTLFFRYFREPGIGLQVVLLFTNDNGVVVRFWFLIGNDDEDPNAADDGFDDDLLQVIAGAVVVVNIICILYNKQPQ